MLPLEFVSFLIIWWNWAVLGYCSGEIIKTTCNILYIPVEILYLHSTVWMESLLVLLLVRGNQKMFPQFQRQAEVDERSSPPLAPILHPRSFLWHYNPIRTAKERLLNGGGNEHFITNGSFEYLSDVFGRVFMDVVDENALRTFALFLAFHITENTSL